jgi:CBS domain-containing protein
MRASDMMTRSVVTVRADTPVEHAAALVAKHGITSLPVLDELGDVVGIVSEADLIRQRMPHDPRSHLRPPTDDERLAPARTVGEVMSHPVACLPPNADSADLAALMIDHDVRAVPIVDGQRLVGIVSRRDLLRTLVRADSAVALDVISILDSYAGKTGQWTADVDGGVVTVSGPFEDDSHRKMVTVLARTVPGVIRVHTSGARTSPLTIAGR